MDYSDLFYMYGNIHALIGEYRIYNKKLKVKGTLFKVDNMTEDMKNYILGWKNTEVVTTKAQYAPEVTHKAFIIYDKCIR